MSRQDSEELAKLPKEKLLELIKIEKANRDNFSKKMIHILCDALAIKEGITDREFGREVSETFGRRCRNPRVYMPKHSDLSENSFP